jgi:hypothetical protein
MDSELTLCKECCCEKTWVKSADINLTAAFNGQAKDRFLISKNRSRPGCGFSGYLDVTGRFMGGDSAGHTQARLSRFQN